MNPNSGTHAASYSLGVIAMQLADLPNHLKHSLNLTGLLGLIPGPREPKASNLYKFLLPLCMELRQAFELGVDVRTPKKPDGEVRLHCRVFT